MQVLGKGAGLCWCGWAGNSTLHVPMEHIRWHADHGSARVQARGCLAYMAPGAPHGRAAPCNLYCVLQRLEHVEAAREALGGMLDCTLLAAPCKGPKRPLCHRSRLHQSGGPAAYIIFITSLVVEYHGKQRGEGAAAHARQRSERVCTRPWRVRETSVHACISLPVTRHLLPAQQQAYRDASSLRRE